MTRFFAAMLVSAAVSSCATINDGASGIIGAVTSEKSDWQSCKERRCFAPTGKKLEAGTGLKSGFGSMKFDVIGLRNRKSSHKLLGVVDAISVSPETQVISFALADGTLSGEVINQPVRITFVPGHNSPGKAAYCEFSTGKYSAINYSLIVFNLSGGEALCFDKDGVEHSVTDEEFSI